MSILPSTSATTSTVPAIRTRSVDVNEQNIPLVGRIAHQVVGAKLPSKRQVLKVLFFHIRIGKLSKRESARFVVKEISIFWEKARIPIRYEARSIEQVIALHKKWAEVRVHVNRRSDTQVKCEKAFMDELDNLFDIAHSNALDLIKNQEDRQFLELQRQPGRPGSMIGVDTKLAAQEQRAAARKENMQVRKRKHCEATQESGTNQDLFSIFIIIIFLKSSK